MRTIIAIWLPTTFAVCCLILTGYSLWFIIPMVCGCADVRARYRDYVSLRQYYRDILFRGIGIKNTTRKYRHSACQRYAAIAAIGPEASKIFWINGYRWYHLLPDGTFSRNCPYISLRFYRQLFMGTT